MYQIVADIADMKLNRHEVHTQLKAASYFIFSLVLEGVCLKTSNLIFYS